jgi:hypothetical protein
LTDTFSFSGGWAEKLKLGKQKAEIARRLARRSAAVSCPPHLPLRLRVFAPLLSPSSAGFSFLLRGQSSNVRWVCCWQEVISIKR